MTETRPDIPEALIAKWQKVVDLTASIVDVPASLVMKTDPPDHAVLISSNSEDNPYTVGQSFELNSKLYCYPVLQEQAELVVRDAHADPDWNDNQDLDHGMTFYIGYPLAWPDGSLFGTICVLDRRDNEHAYLYRELLHEFRRVIENDLALLTEVEKRERAERELQNTLGQLEQRILERTEELEATNTALRVLLEQVETARTEQEERVLRQITHLILPHVAKLKHCVGRNEPGRSYVALVENNLKNLTSTFADSLVGAFEALTPTEVEVAQMVMSGQSTKDIAKALSREKSTIDYHRNNIRKKLGIGNRQVNLRTHLLSLH